MTCLKLSNDFIRGSFLFLSSLIILCTQVFKALLLLLSRLFCSGELLIKLGHSLSNALILRTEKSNLRFTILLELLNLGLKLSLFGSCFSLCLGMDCLQACLFFLCRLFQGLHLRLKLCNLILFRDSLFLILPCLFFNHGLFLFLEGILGSLGSLKLFIVLCSGCLGFFRGFLCG